MKFFLKTRDFAVSGESFKLYLNEELDMLITKPRPLSLDSYYESDDYISHTDARGGIVNNLYQFVKWLSLGRKLKLIQPYYGSNASILDVGAGTGDFVSTAQKGGWQAFGVEPNEKARARARIKGVELSESLEEVTGSYKVITLWHVLEHLPDLEREIDRMVSRLEPEGKLILALPNFRSWDARHYGEYWAAYDLPRHLWHFSRTSIAELFGRRGFEILQISPLWFDAFYISLLSEKYRNSKFRLIKAFINGCRSNLSALGNGEFSSLIYILQKARKA
jgi:SAM-dependent methyltransferase